jgi:hypothetical protein
LVAKIVKFDVLRIVSDKTSFYEVYMINSKYGVVRDPADRLSWGVGG